MSDTTVGRRARKLAIKSSPPTTPIKHAELHDADLSGDAWSLTLLWFVLLPFVLLGSAVKALIDKVRDR